MGNLMASLRNASSAMRIFERGIGVIQGDISNVSTQGMRSSARGLQH